MRQYFAILTFLVLGFSIQLSLVQAEEDKATIQEDRAEKSETAPQKPEESRKRQPNR